MLVGALHLGECPFNEFSHILFAVEDLPRLLVLVDVDLNLLNELNKSTSYLFVNLFVLADQRQQPVDFRVENLVLVESLEVFIAQFILLSRKAFQLILARSNGGFNIVELGQQFFPLRDFVLPIGIIVHRVVLVLVGLNLKAIELYLQFVDGT